MRSPNVVPAMACGDMGMHWMQPGPSPCTGLREPRPDRCRTRCAKSAHGQSGNSRGFAEADERRSPGRRRPGSGCV